MQATWHDCNSVQFCVDINFNLYGCLLWTELNSKYTINLQFRSSVLNIIQIILQHQFVCRFGVVRWLDLTKVANLVM